MNDWFEWKGSRCTAYGVRAVELPPVTLAEERMRFEEVPGRSGSLAMPEGEDVYEDVVLNVTCLMDDPANLSAAAGWLRGAGSLRLANRPGGWYEARVVEKIEMERVIPANEARTFGVSFRAKPCFYLDGAQDIEITGESGTLQNPGNLPSAPRITVYGSGDIGLALSGQLVRLEGIENGIILDTELMDALDLSGAALRNGQMDGDFPTIPPGLSTIAWYSDDEGENPGTVTRIVVTPRWRAR